MSRRRINVRAIIVRENKILAVKHRNHLGEEAKYWALPGGGLDPMESLADGVRREVMEELGVDSEVGRLLFVQQFVSKRDGFDEELEFFFQVKDSPLFDTINLSATTHGSAELVRVAFVDPEKAPILPEFLSQPAQALANPSPDLSVYGF